MAYFLARCLVCLAIVCAPLIAVIASSGDPAMGMLLLIPMIGLIPAYVMALLLFVPTEAITTRHGFGWIANLLVPVLGVVGAVLTFVFLIETIADAEVVARNFQQQPWAFYFWLALGGLWGVLWRISTLVRRLPMFARGPKTV